jgi:hypothetical protein
VSDRKRRPVALDHNFPKPLLQPIAKYIPGVNLHWIRDISDGLAELHDNQLVYELHRRGIPVMITSDHHMVRDVRVLVAIEQTRMTVLTAERIGDDPVFATGVVLRDLLPLLRNDYPQGLVYVSRPSRVRGVRSRELLTRTLPDGSESTPEDLVREHGLPFKARSYYPDDDPRRVW